MAVDLRFEGRVYLRLQPGYEPEQGETGETENHWGEVSILNKKDRYIVGLDIGTTKVTAIVSEITEEGRLDIIGIGSTESKGLRKGMVINLEQTVDSIKRVVEEAELMAGVEIESAYVGLAGGHIKGFNSRSRGGRDQQEPRNNPRRRVSGPSTRPRPFRFRRTGRSCTFCRKSSLWMSRTGYSIPRE